MGLHKVSKTESCFPRKLSLEDIKHNPCLRMLQELFPQKLQQAQDQCLTICLPDIRSIQDDVNLDTEFFDLHILREQVDEGWYKSSNPKLPLIVELVEDKNKLKLLSAPNYHPSFQKGLYYVTISDVILGTNKNFSQYKMFLLDRPLVPKYTKHNLGDINSSSGVSSGVSSLSSSKCPSATSTVKTTISRCNAKTQSRQSSASSMGRPYATTESINGSRVSVRPASNIPKSKSELILNNKRKSKSAPNQNTKTSLNNGNNNKIKKAPRQWSADSGVGTDYSSSSSTTSNYDVLFQCDEPYILPARITAYAESECYLLNLPRCDQFATHLARNLKPLLEELNFKTCGLRKQLKVFATKIHRLAQESVISFPRSASTVNNSPRFTEFLRIAVENVVVGAVHDRVYPAICYLSDKEDREFLICSNYFHNQKIFSADRLGLREDFCIPLTAAVVELAALDMRTTPLDRMTCIYDTVEQVRVHVRQAVLESRGEDICINPSSDCMASNAKEDKDNESDLFYPDDREMILLLASVIIQARPAHLLATLCYADTYAWTIPTDMIDSVTIVSSAVDFIRNFQPTKQLLPSSGKLKREVSMEEIFQLTSELEQSYDRRGTRVEPFRSALEMHRERFAQRLEQSTADRTRRQEEAWAQLDRVPSPGEATLNRGNRLKRGLLATIHKKLICSTDSTEVIENTQTQPTSR